MTSVRRLAALVVLAPVVLALGSCGGDADPQRPAATAPPAPAAEAAQQPVAGGRAVTLADPSGDAGGARGLDLLGGSVSVDAGRAVVRVSLSAAAADRRLRLELGSRGVDVVQRGGRLTARGASGAAARAIGGGLEVSLAWPGSRPPRRWGATTFAASEPAAVDRLGTPAGASAEAASRSERW